jgi:hypothetical protein
MHRMVAGTQFRNVSHVREWAISCFQIGCGAISYTTINISEAEPEIMRQFNYTDGLRANNGKEIVHANSNKVPFQKRKECCERGSRVTAARWIDTFGARNVSQFSECLVRNNERSDSFLRRRKSTIIVF